MTGTALIPTPNTIQANLNTIDSMMSRWDLEGADDEVKLARRMIRAAASNVLLLFELQADEATGEFKLQNYGQAWMLADLLRKSNMVPSSYKNDEQVVIGLMKAMEIGIPPISGLSNIMIVNNRPSVWGDLAQALVQRTGLIEKMEREEVGTKPALDAEIGTRGQPGWPLDYGWKVTFWRKGQEGPAGTRTYTVADAKRAGLWAHADKKPWITDPGTMLFNRARAGALRDGFADCLFGLGIIEEQQDFSPIDGGALGKPAAPAPDDEPVTQEMLEHQQRAEPPNYAERGAPVETAEDVQRQDGDPPPGTLPL